MRSKDSRADGSYSTQFARRPIAKTRLSKLDFSTRSSDEVFKDPNEVITRKMDVMPHDVDVADLSEEEEDDNKEDDEDEEEEDDDEMIVSSKGRTAANIAEHPLACRFVMFTSTRRQP